MAQRTLIRLKDAQPWQARVLDKAGLAKHHNIEIPEDLVWDAENHHTIEDPGFTEPLLSLLKSLPEFEFIEPTSGIAPPEDQSGEGDKGEGEKSKDGDKGVEEPPKPQAPPAGRSGR